MSGRILLDAPELRQGARLLGQGGAHVHAGALSLKRAPMPELTARTAHVREAVPRLAARLERLADLLDTESRDMAWRAGLVELDLARVWVLPACSGPRPRLRAWVMRALGERAQRPQLVLLPGGRFGLMQATGKGGKGGGGLGQLGALAPALGGAGALGSKLAGPASKAKRGAEAARAAGTKAAPATVRVGGRTLPAYKQGAGAQGVLRIGSREMPLKSGYTGPVASSAHCNLPRTGNPGMNWRIRSHVESHAIAVMKQEETTRATLYINRVPCPGTEDVMMRCFLECFLRERA